MSTLEEQEAMAVAIQQLNGRLQQQETAMTILAQERERLAQQVQSMSSTRVVDTRVIGKPDQSDEVRGLVVQTEIVSRSRQKHRRHRDSTRT